MQDLEQDTRSITRVLHGIVGNIEVLVESQVGLAKAELREVVQGGAHAALPLGLGVILAQAALGVLLFAAASGLATRVPMWLAALGVGGATALVALLLIAQGRRALSRLGHSPDPAPLRRGEVPHG